MACVMLNHVCNVLQDEYILSTGGAFDPLGLASADDSKAFRLKTAEIKHGRLAMIAFLGKSCTLPLFSYKTARVQLLKTYTVASEHSPCFVGSCPGPPMPALCLFHVICPLPFAPTLSICCILWCLR